MIERVILGPYDVLSEPAHAVEDGKYRTGLATEWASSRLLGRKQEGFISSQATSVVALEAAGDGYAGLFPHLGRIDGEQSRDR